MVGLFQFDLVASIFWGQDAAISRGVYIIVGFCAIYSLKFIPLLNNRYSNRDV
ncbi:DUF378 domain-containing protein [Peribacillus sp. B-H-3]|uniref:DUF378 domain-containing protein n=1 Tax=Peribacillus sp. B-H-3 TaxID=3400420 RepID=UPI003B015ED6